MRSRTYWKARLDEGADRLKFNEGYKLLYCPWSAIGTADFLFVSLNPGRPPENIERRQLSEELGNSYELERTSTKSPITKQFNLLLQFLGVEANRFLVGVIAPYRSDNWAGLSAEQKKGSLEIGRDFWSEILANATACKIITVSDVPADVMIKLTDAKLLREIHSGWGSTKLRLYKNSRGTMIVALPHLSSYKLFSRSDCRAPLDDIFSELRNSERPA